MKTLVGLAIVGMCLLASISYAEDIEVSNFIKITLINGDYYSCSDTDIASGCKLNIDERFVTLLNKPVAIRSNTASISFYIETYYVNHKFPINNVTEIEYR